MSVAVASGVGVHGCDGVHGWGFFVRVGLVVGVSVGSPVGVESGVFAGSIVGVSLGGFNPTVTLTTGPDS